MKKNVVLLVAIAFGVALVSTALFYGMFAGKLRDVASGPRGSIVVAARNLERGTVLTAQDLRVASWGGELPKGALASAEATVGMTVVAPVGDGEPVLQGRLASAEKGSGGGMGIPSGMRAVSMHVSDSSGIIAMLRPGHRIDIQVVVTRPNNDAELRTLLQNVEVLAVAGQPEPGPARVAGPVVTVLASPAEAEALGLADSAAKIRISLRNPLDSGRFPGGSLAMAALFRNSPPVREGVRPQAPVVAGSLAAGPVSFWVRIAGAASGAVEELNASLAGNRSAELLQIAAFRPGFEIEQALRRLQEKREIEMLSASRIQAGSQGQAGFDVSARGGEALSVRVKLQALPSKPGMVRLRVLPETTSPGKSGVATRRFDTELNLAEGGTFALTGLVGRDRSVLDRLFPGQLKQSGSQELLVLVTAQRRGVGPAALGR